MASPAHFGEYPWTAGERRLVTHVLPMATGQVGYPIALLILVKPDNRLFHDCFKSSRLTTADCL
jgi:hypothetical protein